MKSFFSSIFPSVFKSVQSPPQHSFKIQYSQSSDSLQILLNDSFYVISLRPNEQNSDESLHSSSAQNLLFKMEACSLSVSSLNFGAEIIGFSEISGPSYCVSLVDSYLKKEIKQLYFKNKVTSLKLLKSYLIISFEYQIWVYNILPFQIKETFKTCFNPAGLIDASQNFILLSYGAEQHELRLQFLKAEVIKQIQPFSQKRSLGNFSISKSGKLVGVSDEDGIQIKIIDAYSNSILKSLRRGLSPCKHSSLAFSLNDSLFAMASQRKTIHIFKLSDLEEIKQQDQNARESFISKGLQILDEYVSPISLSSEKSSIKIRLEQESPQSQHQYCISFSKELAGQKLLVTQEEGKTWCYEVNGQTDEATLLKMELNWKQFIGSGKWRTVAEEQKRAEESEEWIYVKGE